MTMRAVSLALAVLFAAPAAADDGADISGHWTFATGPYHVVCTMTGEVTLSPTSDPDVFEGELVAWEACAGRPRFEAVQSAVAVRDGDGLTITSTLVTVTPTSDLYWPDNFELRIVNGSLMLGELLSGTIVAKAQFRRADGPIA